MHLGLNDDELVACVACGLCLPHCPTFVVTGRDTESPRGRIALMRAVQNEGAPVTDDVIRSMETCVQCRGCETACPSAVPFGHLMEGTRAALADAGRITPRWQRLALRMLRHRRLLLAGSTLLAIGHTPAPGAHQAPRPAREHAAAAPKAAHLGRPMCGCSPAA